MAEEGRIGQVVDLPEKVGWFAGDQTIGRAGPSRIISSGVSSEPPCRCSPTADELLLGLRLTVVCRDELGSEVLGTVRMLRSSAIVGRGGCSLWGWKRPLPRKTNSGSQPSLGGERSRP